MAIIQLTASSGLTVGVHIRNSTGKIWNVTTSAFVTYGGNLADYVVPGTEQGSSGYYLATRPTDIIAVDVYTFVWYELVLGIPVGDPLASGSFEIKTSSPIPTPVDITTVNTRAYYLSQLATIDAKIDAMISNPRPDYKVGDVSMNFGSLLEKLYSIREKIVDRLNSMQGESFETINTDINPFGQDLADYVNDGTDQQ